MRNLTVLAAILAMAAAARGADTPATTPATMPSVDQWTVRPSAVSKDPLKYRLLPDWTEMSPGNAVPLYLEAKRYWPDQKTTNDVLDPENKRLNYLDTPIDQFPREDAEKLLAAYADTLALVERGARRQSAAWDDDWPDSAVGSKALLYNNDLRHANNLLSFKARYEVSRRNWAAASHTMQTAMAMSRHVGSAPMLFHGLVEEGFAIVTLWGGVEEWIERGDSPNLYWALSNLPHPYVELEPIARAERIPTGGAPLSKAMRGELPPEQWGAVVREMFGRLEESRTPYKRDPVAMEAAAKSAITSAYPRATQYLLAVGVPKEQVEAMSREEAVGTYFCREDRAASDELWKCWGLPFPRAFGHMRKAWAELAPDRAPLVDNPLFQAEQVSRSPKEPSHSDYSMPDMVYLRYWLSEVDRDIALFRTIEALRDYAARHDGRPPERLDDVTDLPVPEDPITGRPFEYSCEGQTVHLQALTPWYWRSGRNLEITFVK